MEVDEPTVHIRAPRVEPRQGTAVRCEGLAIGYPDHVVADNISLEIEHGERVAIVGDNGQGKTTLLRTLVDSLDPLAGTIKWGYGVEHRHLRPTRLHDVWTSGMTVLEHLEYTSDADTTRQDLLAMAGALLFRDEHIQQKDQSPQRRRTGPACAWPGCCSGRPTCWCWTNRATIWTSKRSRRWPKRLLQYKGTVIFTSHDRHFMRRVATSVIEVRDGSVKKLLWRLRQLPRSRSKAKSTKANVNERDRQGQGKCQGRGLSGQPPKSKSTDYRRSPA